MIGIYKIENQINHKIYIGQSNDIQRRFKEHRYRGHNSRISLDAAIEKYGKDNFSYDVIEECSLEELNDREQYWIKYYNSQAPNGYNLTEGGNQQSIGENNGRHRLTEEDVKDIRIRYNNHERKRKVYEDYADLLTFGSFESVWEGKCWKHIMPEVFTEENKLYYSRQATNGENGITSVFTNAEVLQIRQRYVNETAREIYNDYSDRCSYQTLQQVLWGRTYSDIPIYYKKQKKWSNE